MSFLGQAAKIFGNTAEFNFQVVLFGRDAVYLEGAKPVKIDESEMIFRIPQGLLSLVGDGLKIKELTDDCVSVTGRISDLAVKDL